MCVHRKAGQTQRDASDHVRGLSSYAAKRYEINHGPWYLSVELVDKAGGHRNKILGLPPKEPNGVDETLYILLARHRQVGGSRILPKQSRRDLVDRDVGGLSRQDRGHEQLEGVAMIELTHCLGILQLQALERSACAALRRPRACHVTDDTLPHVTITSSQVEQGEFSVNITVGHEHPRENLAADLSAAIAAAPARLDGTRAVQVWFEEVQDGDDALVADQVLPYRDLLHMRRSLPADPSGITTRGFDVETDADALIEVNNRAFAWHPEQSGYSRDRLEAAMAEVWFSADGLRILELEDRIAGFCWTKIHSDHDLVLGEIYVIALDPDFHGRGLGGPMTLAGLEWLSSQGITTAGLYVESDNYAAVRTYDRLGFVVHSINRAYRSKDTSTNAPADG